MESTLYLLSLRTYVCNNTFILIVGSYVQAQNVAFDCRSIRPVDLEIHSM